MSFMDFLPSSLIPPLQRARGETRKIISHPPFGAQLHKIRPRADGVAVRAWLAERTGEIQSAQGALHYRAGKHFIIEHGPRDFGVVRTDIFDKLYRQIEGDLYAKRTDLVLRYFTLERYARIQTLEGVQSASPGDWIIQGVKGELWPVPAEKARKKYEAV